MKSSRHGGVLGGVQGWLAILVAPLAVAIYLYSVSASNSLPYAILPVAASLLAIILLWKNRPNSGAFALIALYLCGELFTGTALDIVFSALYINALWMAFGCFVLGVAIARSGLIERLARVMAGFGSASYIRLIFGLVVLGFLLSLFVPTAIARIFIVLPIAITLVDELGGSEFFSPGRSQRKPADADVLIIDNDFSGLLGGFVDYTPYYTEALDELGMTYEVLDTAAFCCAASTIPDAATLSAYDSISARC